MIPTKAASSHRFEVLDGLRGFAALIVVLVHAQEHFGFEIIHHGYLMVDLFFGISGFVLAAAYGDRLAKGDMGRRFMKVRLLRLYPMALLGLSVGALFHVFATRYLPIGHSLQPGWPLLAASLLFLPLLAGGSVSPLNGPGWSLIFEVWINAAYGYFAPKLTSRRLMVVVALALLGLVATLALTGDLDAGARRESFLGGLARVLFSFPLGLLIQRLWAAGALKGLRFPASMASGMPAALALIALVGKSGLFDLAVVTAIFPVMILLSVTATAQSIPAKLFAFTGRISYPLYALHGPVLFLYKFGLAAVGLPQAAAADQRAAALAGGMMLTVGLAWAADRWIDAPLRKWIAADARVSRLVAA